MATRIEWCDETINPVIGCKPCSPGCEHCYAEVMARRLVGMKVRGYGEVVSEGRWNGRSALVERELAKPFWWGKPRRIFVCSMGDLFHTSVPDEWVDRVMTMIAMCRRHTFILLTKRADRMNRYMNQFVTGNRSLEDCLWDIPSGNDLRARVSLALGAFGLAPGQDVRLPFPPMRNMIGMVTVCNQDEADAKIPWLIDTPLSARGISVEPMLGPVDIGRFVCERESGARLDWVICGGETGPGARPLRIEWVRGLRDQCVAAGVPFFLKRLGRGFEGRELDGRTWEKWPRVGGE